MKTGTMTAFGLAWTAKEDRVLREAYAAGGLAAAVRALPKRTELAIHQRAQRKGLTRRARWNADDDRILRDRWGIDPIASIAKQVQRSVYAVYRRAAAIKLQTGCPQGFEYVGAAALRTGFTHAGILRVLRWANIRPMIAYGPYSAHSKTPKRIVDTFDVDEAVERWMKSETLVHAARRVGLSGLTIIKWIREAGEDPGRRTSSSIHSLFRIDPDLVDRVVAARRKQESLDAAAKRVHMDKARLLRALRAAGAEVSPATRVRRRWRFDPEFVDRVVRNMKESRDGTSRIVASDGHVPDGDGGGARALSAGRETARGAEPVPEAGTGA